MKFDQADVMAGVQFVASPALQREFGDIETFLAYHRAHRAGMARVIGNPRAAVPLPAPPPSPPPVARRVAPQQIGRPAPVYGKAVCRSVEIRP